MVFVGREAELTRLAAALERARDGSSTVVALRGPAGIGASRLLSELEERLAGLPGVVVARGRAFEPYRGVPYAPVIDALRPVLRDLSDARLSTIAGNAGPDLALLLPELRERLEEARAIPDEPMVSAPDQLGGRIGEVVLGVLERLAVDGVVLLALEDLQWADPATLDLVQRLLRVGRPLRLCLLLTYRPDELHRRHPMAALATAIDRHSRVERVEMSALDRDDIVELVQARLGERPSGSFVAAVLEGSAGSPLLAEQIVAVHRSPAGVRLSASFEELVEVRLATLSVGAVRVLRALAAARRPLPRSVVQTLDLPGGRAGTSSVDEAIASGLIETRRDPAHTDVAEPNPATGHFAPRAVPRDDGSVLELAHERYAEAIEALELPQERQAIHAVLAAVLAEEPAVAAWHLEAGMRFAEARNAHVSAGIGSEQLDPGGTALLHYGRALELIDADADGVPKLEMPVPQLLARAAEAAYVAGESRRAAQLVRQAINLRASTGVLSVVSGRGNDARRELQLEVGAYYEQLGRYRWAAGDTVPSLAAFESAVQLVPMEPTRQRARALALLGQHLMLDGRFEESATLCLDAIQAAGGAGDDAVGELGHATCTLAVDAAYEGDIARGLVLLDEAGRMSRRARRLDDVMRVYANRTTLLDLDLRREEAVAVVTEGIAEARRWGQEAAYGAFLRGNAADCLFTLGRWADSEEECRAALEWSPPRLAWNPILFLGLVLVESRADEEATRTVGQILLQLESVPQGQWSALLHRTAVSFALWRDDMADARRVAERGWERVVQTGDWTQLAVAASTTLEACAAAAEAARARRDMVTVAAVSELAQRALAVADSAVKRDGMPASVGARREAELHLGMARAHLGRIRNRPDADAWERLAEQWEGVPAPYERAKALWWAGAAALKARDARPRARAALVEAWRLSRELPARPLQRAILALAQRGRITLPEAAEMLEAPTPPLPPLFAAAGVGPERGARDRARVPAFTPAGTTAGATTARAGDSDGSGGIRDRLLPPAAAPAADPFGLSPREHEVLRVLAEGRTNREIAERLFISERTVDVHVRNILGKLGVAGRVEATSVALRLGLVTGLPGVAPVPRG